MPSKTKESKKEENFCQKFWCKCQKPLNPVLVWLAIGGVTLSSFFIISVAIAQTATITDPVVPLTPEPTLAVEPAPAPAPTPVNCGQCKQAKADGTCEDLPFGSTDPSGGCSAGQVCDGHGGCVEVKNPQLAPSTPSSGSDGSGVSQQQPSGPNEEERQQEMDERRLKDMKKGFSRFIKEMKRAKSQISIYQKRGVNIPEELTTALTKVDEGTVKIQEATNPDDLEMIMGDFEDSVQTIQEWLHKLPRLAQLPRIIKQAEREITRVKRALATDERKAKAAKLDLTDQLTEFRNIIGQQDNLLNEIKELVKTDPEEAMDRLQDEFFSNLDNVWENDRVIQTVLNIKRGIFQIQRDLRETGIMLKNLKKRKIDTAELEELYNTAKTQFEEVKRLAGAKPIDIDALVEAVDMIMETRQTFDDKLQEVTGEEKELPGLQGVKGINLNIPRGFITEGGNGGGPAIPSTPQPGLSQPTCNINGVEVPGRCEELEKK